MDWDTYLYTGFVGEFVQCTCSTLHGARRMLASLRLFVSRRDFNCLLRLKASLSSDPCPDPVTPPHTSTHTGLHTSTFKVPVSSISTPVPHLYVEHKGLSDTSVMQAWMAAAEVTAGAPSAPSAAAECGPDSGQARAASASADGGSESDSCQTPPAVSSEGSLDSPSVRVRWYQDGGIEVSDTELIKKGGSVAHGVGGGVVGATN